MTTLARTRAETLFSSITTRADRAIEPPAPLPQLKTKSRQAGPNTLHLPTGAHHALAGWPVANPRRPQKPALLGRTW
jgi:hypothetical protein